MRKLIPLIILIVLFTSCGTGKKTTNTTVSNIDSCEAMTYTNTMFSEIETDYYTVDTLFIVNDCLNIWASYGGGCGDSEFTLFFGNRILESYPPKTNLMLKLVDNDNCRAIVQQKLFYDLSFFGDYAKDGGIVIKLAGTDLSVLYKK